MCERVHSNRKQRMSVQHLHHDRHFAADGPNLNRHKLRIVAKPSAIAMPRVGARTDGVAALLVELMVVQRWCGADAQEGNSPHPPLRSPDGDERVLPSGQSSDPSIPSRRESRLATASPIPIPAAKHLQPGDKRTA